MAKKLGTTIFLHVPLREQVLFAKHLAIMVKTGMPLLDSLKLLQKQAKSGSLKKILDYIIDEVSNGQFLSTGLDRFRRIFGDLFVNIVRVGEASGILYENLNYLAIELNKRQLLRKKIRGAMIYPMVILVATVGVAALLTMYIFPKILPIFQSMKIALPITTRMLMAISSFMVSYGHFVLLGIIVFIIAFIFLLRIKAIRYIFHRLILMLPVIGTISKDYNMANFCRTFGLLLKSDVKVVEAMSITSETLTNLVYRKKLREVAVQITQGEEISKHLEKSSKIFPAMVSQMIAIGEATGNLSETLVYLSDYYEAEVEEQTKNLSTIIEPVLMIFMGIIVGFIALSIVGPIYQVSQGLKLR